MLGNKRWHLFNLFGNEVYLTPSFLFILVLFAGMGVRTLDDLMVGLLWIPVLFLGILLHELGHALASSSLGYGNSQIVFWGLGGLAINRSTRQRSPKHSILISLAGPAVSLLLAIVSGVALFALEGALTSTGLFGEFLKLMLWANGFWAVFNLLPIYPMDGGQAMQSGLQIATKQRSKATKYTGYVSIGALVLMLGGWSVVLGPPGLFLILITLYFGYLNWQLIQNGPSQRSWVG